MGLQRRRLYQAISSVALPGLALGMLAALPLTPAQAQATAAELKILSPKAGESLGANAFSLDVAFHSRTSAPIATAELWVDGVRWVRRDLDTPQVKNVLSFAIDATTLSEGSHAFLVRVFTTTGGVGETKLQIVAGSNAGVVTTAPNAPDLTFATPGNGRRVLGQVELLIDSPAKNGLNPYVTIYVDKQFKTLKNFPPYSYTWDTSNVSNGPHTIEATSYLDSTKESTSRRIRVFVDNPGGNTEIKKDIPDLSLAARGKTASAAKVVALAFPTHGEAGHKAAHGVAGVARLGTPTAHFVPAHEITPVPSLVPTGVPIVSDRLSAVTHVAVVAAPAVSPMVATAAESVAVPVLNLQAPVFAPVPVAIPPVHKQGVALAVRVPAVTAPDPSFPAPSAAVSVHEATVVAPVVSPVPLPVSAVVVAAPTMATVSSVVSVVTASSVSSELSAPTFSAASVPIRSVRVAPVTMANDTVVARPATVVAARLFGAAPLAVAPHLYGGNLSAVMSSAAVPASAFSGTRSAIRPQFSHAGHRLVVRPTVHGAFQPSPTRNIQVAFNGEQIAFDVQPRVEAGLPLAPFRQIFEHTGGQVDWVEKTQVVHAVNAEREIVITVGKSTALVNGRNVTLDRPAFVERGRTIVPLSFVGSALDVTVKYDSATGRLQITGK